jgi:hypothetical protein
VSNCSKRSTTALASSRRIEIVVMVPSIQNPRQLRVRGAITTYGPPDAVGPFIPDWDVVNHHVWFLFFFVASTTNEANNWATTTNITCSMAVRSLAMPCVVAPIEPTSTVCPLFPVC